jgi:hypothetical protein
MLDWNFDMMSGFTILNIVSPPPLLRAIGCCEFYICFAACYPYYQEDPFIISECPDIYFAGNQPQFQSKLYEGKC